MARSLPPHGTNEGTGPLFIDPTAYGFLSDAHKERHGNILWPQTDPLFYDGKPELTTTNIDNISMHTVETCLLWTNHAQVRLWSVPDRTFWGPVWDPELEEYLLTGDHTDTTYKQEFELLDGGTYNNIPLNTRPRPSDFNDTAPQV